jgi:hypothetical protein
MNNNYVFNDSPQRNLIINIKSDSTFLLRNAVRGDLAYSFIGQWRKIDEHKLILINKYRGTDSDSIAPPEGGRIDSVRAYSDKGYIFPPIYIDTLVFNKRHKTFDLKGYTFKLGKRI